MSAFSRMFAVAHAALVGHFGERVLFTPAAGAGEPRSRYVVAGADPARPARELSGIFDGNPIAAKVTGSGANSQANVDVITARYAVSFAASDFAGHPPPQRGDVIKALDQPGQPEFKIAAVEPDNVSEIVCRLVERGVREAP